MKYQARAKTKIDNNSSSSIQVLCATTRKQLRKRIRKQLFEKVCKGAAVALQHFELPRLLQQHSQPEPAPCTSLPVPFFFHFHFSFLNIHVRALHRNFVLVFFSLSLFIFSINNSTLHKPSCSCLFSFSQELLQVPCTSLPVLAFFHFRFSFS